MKVLGKTERTGKFGKISLMIQRNLSCAVIWIEFILIHTCFDSRHIGFCIVLLKAQLV